MRSLQNAQETKAYRYGHLCLGVRTFELEKRWTILDEIWYGLYATRTTLKS
jgi:hypothetical protein